MIHVLAALIGIVIILAFVSIIYLLENHPEYLFAAFAIAFVLGFGYLIGSKILGI